MKKVTIPIPNQVVVCPDTLNHSYPISQEHPGLQGSSQCLVLVIPPKVSNKHHWKVDDNNDFVDPVPQCASRLASTFRLSH